jgi:hypothetical protein
VGRIITRRLLYQYDCAASTDFEYGCYSRDFQSVPKAVATSGSSTTVSESPTGAASFNAVGVGDLLYNPATGDTVRVTAKASSAQITVNTAVNWSTGTNIQVQKFQLGQTEADGWVGIGGASRVTLHLEVATLGSASVQFALEVRAGGNITSRVLTPAALTAITVSSTTGVNSQASILITDGGEAFRLGTLVVTDSTDVVSANLVIEYL